jgi:ribonuclease VapC
MEVGSPRLLSAASLLEATIVIESRKGEAGGRKTSYRTAIEVVAVDHDQAEIARIARRFGKGRHPGDCFADALAKCRNQPSLYCGNDFAKPDIPRVMPA